MTTQMQQEYNATPVDNWKDMDGYASTPVYPLPSVNYIRNFVAGQDKYQATLFSRNGEFKVMKNGKVFSSYRTRVSN